MKNLIIVAGILIVIMLIFLFILLKNIIKRMDENAKKYFVNKMKDYDYILEEKQDELEKIKTEISETLADNRNILQGHDEVETEEDKNEKKEQIEEEEDNEITTKKPKTEMKVNLNIPEYREINFFNNYKQVRKTFTVNNEKIIKEFVAEHKNIKEQREYRALKKLRSKFDEQTVYNCLTINSTDQIKILNEALTDTEKKLIGFNKIIKNNNFDIKYLIKFIDNRLEQIEPIIYIYTNAIENKYESLDKNIVVNTYSNMSEGIIIRYRNKIYDYSI